MKFAYLLSQYPTMGHTYLLREMQGLRAIGFDLPTASIQAPDRTLDKMLPSEREEAERTFYVLGSGFGRFLADHVRTFATRPLPYLQTLWFAVSRGRLNPLATLRHLAYVAEAVVAGQRMLRQGVSHFHTHFSTTVGLFITKIFPITMSMTIHGGDEFVNPAGSFLPEKIQAARFVSTISYYAQSQMMQLVSSEFWNRFNVLPLGVFPEEYEPAPYRESPEPFEVNCVGRLMRFKAQHVLLDSISRLRKEGRNVRLRLVGDGPDRASLERRIVELGLSEAVIIEGWKNQAEVRELYKKADVFALASFTEGVPVVLMEAMGMRVPCIATRITGIPELIRDDIDGLLVTPSDAEELARAIARLMDDSALRRRLAEAGQQRVQEKYNQHLNVKRMSEVFARRLGKPSSAASV